jgi:hypothetical protein
LKPAREAASTTVSIPDCLTLSPRRLTQIPYPSSVHTGDVRDVADAVEAQANSIEHGSFREKIPDALFDQMARQGIFYDPTLSVGEAFKDFAAGKTDLLKRSLVQQVGPPELLRGTEEAMGSAETDSLRTSLGRYPLDMAIAIDVLLGSLALGHVKAHYAPCWD